MDVCQRVRNIGDGVRQRLHFGRARAAFVQVSRYSMRLVRFTQLERLTHEQFRATVRSVVATSIIRLPPQRRGGVLST
jgi:hypothetical protein